MTETESDSIALAIRRIAALIDRVHRDAGERGERRRTRAHWAWEGVRRYRSFVGFALEERRSWGAKLVEAHAEHQGFVIHREQRRPYDELRAEIADLTLRTHYAIECFFAFGKILLDRVALAIEATFGNAKGFRPSHGALLDSATGLVAYATARGIAEPPPELITRALALEETLTRFRDHMIVHPVNVRVTSETRFTPTTGEVDFLTGIHLPTEAETEAGWPQAPLVREMVEEINAYLDAVVAWVELCLADLVEVPSSPPQPRA